MEKFYHQIKILFILLILFSCNTKPNTQDNLLNKDEINTILINSKWSVDDLFIKYIDTINQTTNKIPAFINKYPKYLKEHERYLTIHDIKDGRKLSYELILEKSNFAGVINLRRSLILKENRNSNEQLVLDIINYSIQNY